MWQSMRPAPRALLRILSINDVYKLENLSRLKTMLDEKEAEAEQIGRKLQDGSKTIKVLAGDFLSPNVLSPIDSGFSFLKCFNGIGITHYCFGNHEANLQLDQLEERLRECNGKVLNSNIPSFDRPILPSTDIIEIGSLKVGLLGLLSDEKSIFRKQMFKGFVIENVVESATQLSTRLRRDNGCAAVVAITHQSIHRDRQLATLVPLAAIVGGHEHSPFEEDVQGTKIVKTGMNAENLGVLDIAIYDEMSVQVAYFRERIHRNKSITKDARTEALVKSCMDLVAQLDSEIMINYPRPIQALGTRFRQTELGSILCDYIKLEMDTHVAAINGATIKPNKDFKDGNLSFADLQTVLPFPTKLVTVEMPGSVLQDALRHSRSSAAWDIEKRGFLQLDSGVVVSNPTISGKYGSEEDVEHSCERDTILAIHEEPFDPHRNYLVALPRNLLKGFCNITPLVEFAKIHPNALPDPDVYIPALEVVLRHCAKNMWAQLGCFEDIDANHDGRITKEELSERVSKVFGKGPSEEVLASLINSIDLDKDGFVSQAEFDRLKRKV